MERDHNLCEYNYIADSSGLSHHDLEMEAKKLIPKNQEYKSQVTHTRRIGILQTLLIYRVYLITVSIAVQIFIAHAQVGRATNSSTEMRNAQTGTFTQTISNHRSRTGAEWRRVVFFFF